jgi:hypothetical protein
MIQKILYEVINVRIVMSIDSKQTDKSNHPISLKSISNIDMIVTKKDGHVELSIIVAGYLDESNFTEERILQKLNYYLTYINSPEFYEEFGEPSAEKIGIILKCSIDPHEAIYDLINTVQSQVNSNNATLRIET